MEELWNELLKKEIITRGWHLARADTKQDFSEDLYSTDVYGQDLKNNVKETINRLSTGTYQPRPLFRMEVPKGTLTFRPGTVIPIYDRVVLSAIVLLIAPEIDKKLTESVYSWRLKKPIPKRGSIFRETDITDLPFLEKNTIRQKIDPFEDWYLLWPQFDKRTRRVFQDEGYKYLGTSDIAAYFENIQLPILRDQLLQHLPNEGRIVNLLCQFLEIWSEKTDEGRPHYRGIPQGNFVSSFLGNLFLMPLDEALEKFSKSRDVEYFRYMDDVRIFTKKREDARLAVLEMARKLRELHLNVQTAKTRIYDETHSEISKLLIDPRVDELSDLIDEIQKLQDGEGIPSPEKENYIDRLHAIARADIEGIQKIIPARTPLEGLNIRCFKRWIYALSILGSNSYINRLLTEIGKNADHKLTQKLVKAARNFPRNRSIETKVLKMIQNGQIIFPFQEAECLRALRYLSTLKEDTMQHCWDRLLDKTHARYLRMEAAYLLSRMELNEEQLINLHNSYDEEQDAYVQVAKAILLVQRRKKNQDVVDMLVFHPNEKVRDIGKLFHAIKNDKSVAKDKLTQAFRQEVPWMLCDYMPFIYLMAESRNDGIRKMLLDAIRKPRGGHPIKGIRLILQKIFTRVRESLANRS
jgi:retron-type reverse transcriptase